MSDAIGLSLKWWRGSVESVTGTRERQACCDRLDLVLPVRELADARRSAEDVEVRQTTFRDELADRRIVEDGMSTVDITWCNRRVEHESDLVGERHRGEERLHSVTQIGFA